MAAPVIGGPSPAVLVTDVRRAVAALRAGAPGQDAAGWEHAERQSVISKLDELVQELTVYRGQVLLAHRKDGRWGGAHDRDFADWRARQTGTGRGPVLGELQLAEGLEAMPEVAGAVERGELNVEHAKALSRLRSSASPEVREAIDGGGLADLLEAGKEMSAPELGKKARAWAAGIDAAAAQKDFDTIRARRSVSLRTHAGGVKGEFFLDPVAGAELRTALDAIAGRPSVDDQRTREARMADALSVMASRVLQVGADLNGAQVRPHIALLVSEETWTAIQRGRLDTESAAAEVSPGGRPEGSAFAPPAARPAAPVLPDAPPAVLEDGTLVPLRELERIMCDCEITRMVMTADGVPLDVGQTQRTYTKELRRAITTRDRTCQWPGCQLRASWCEVHHIRWFSHGGATSLDNAITLCSYHHHRVHDQHITITTRTDGFDFHHRDGREVGTTRRQARPHRRAERPRDTLTLSARQRVGDEVVTSRVGPTGRRRWDGGGGDINPYVRVAPRAVAGREAPPPRIAPAPRTSIDGSGPPLRSEPAARSGAVPAASLAGGGPPSRPRVRGAPPTGVARTTATAPP